MKRPKIHLDTLPKVCECAEIHANQHLCSTPEVLIERRGKRLWVCSNCTLPNDVKVVELRLA